MKRVKIMLSALVLAGLVTAAGCGNVKFEPSESSIFAKKDGSVVSADFEDFDGDNYSLDELTTYVEDAVSSYNKDHDAEEKAYSENNETLPVAIESINVSEEKKASLFLDYATTADYLEFTGTGGTEDGISEFEITEVGDIPDVKFTKADGTDISNDALSVSTSCRIVTIDGPISMVVQGTVKYVSEGVEIVDNNTVTTPAGAVSYVIFK